MLVIAHRGASMAAQENTVRAFELAVAMGADGIELDVRLAPDGRLLVKHDPLTVPDDIVARLAHGHDPIDLDTALAACGGVLVNVEIKNSSDEDGDSHSLAVVEPTVAALRSAGSPTRWIISSFDWPTIQRCRHVAPDIPTAFLVVDLSLESIERTVAAGHTAIHPHESSVDASLVRRCHDDGLAVTVWTCNDAGRLCELAEMGVDGVCTDVPDIALTALGRRSGPVMPRWGRPV